MIPPLGKAALFYRTLTITSVAANVIDRTETGAKRYGAPASAGIGIRGL